MLSWLMFANDPEKCATTDAYLMHLVEQRYTVEPLPRGFFVLKNKDDLWIEFAVLEDVGGYIAEDHSTITEGRCVFHGGGPSGNLRECRHTYWGKEDGYIHYPHGPLITAAFKRLSEFFDDMEKGAR